MDKYNKEDIEVNGRVSFNWGSGPIYLCSFDSIKQTLAYAITERIADWYKQWNGEEFGFEAKSDIYTIVSDILENGVEI